MTRNYFFKAMLATIACGAAALAGGCGSDDDNTSSGNSISAPFAQVAYSMADKTENVANYYLTVSTVALDESGKPTGAGDVYYFDLYANAPQTGAARIPAAGSYNYDATNSQNAGTLAAESTFKQSYTKQGTTVTPGAIVKFTTAKVKVSVSGNKFSIVADITLESGETIRVKTSNIAGLEASTDLEKDVELIPAAVQAAYFPLIEAKLTGYIIDFITEDESEMVEIQFVSAENPFKNGITAGDYSTSTEPGPGFAFPGAFNTEIELPTGCYYQNTDGVFGYLTECEISITKNNDDTYVVSVVGMTDNAHTVSVEFEGEINYASLGESTWKNDHTMDLSNVSGGTAIFFGDGYKNGTGAWILTLDPGIANKEGFQAELCVQSSTSEDIPTGTFTQSGSEGPKAGTYYPGYQAENETLNSTLFYTYDADGEFLAQYATIKKGSIKIEAAAESKYTITLDLYDGNLNHLTGNWNGPITFQKPKSSAKVNHKISMQASGKMMAAKMAVHQKAKMSSFIR